MYGSCLGSCLGAPYVIPVRVPEARLAGAARAVARPKERPELGDTRSDTSLVKRQGKGVKSSLYGTGAYYILLLSLDRLRRAGLECVFIVTVTAPCWTWKAANRSRPCF